MATSGNSVDYFGPSPSILAHPCNTDQNRAELDPPKLPKVQPSLMNPIVTGDSVDDFSPFNFTKIILLENDDGSPIVANHKSTLKALEVHLRDLFAEYKSFELDIETTTFGDVYGESSNRSEPTSVHRKRYLESERELVLKAHRDRLMHIRGYDSLRTYANSRFESAITIRVLRKINSTLTDKLGVTLSVVEDMNLEEAVANLVTRPAVTAGKSIAETDVPAVKSKKSTTGGDCQTKLLSALALHHKYSQSGCLNLEPVGSNVLARAAEVEKSTASKFFKDNFDGYTSYKSACRDAKGLHEKLKSLYDDYAYRRLYRGEPIVGDE